VKHSGIKLFATIKIEIHSRGLGEAFGYEIVRYHQILSPECFSPTIFFTGFILEKKTQLLYCSFAVEIKVPKTEIFAKQKNTGQNSGVETMPISIIAEGDRQNWEKLQELLKVSGGEEIYRFMSLLKALGLKTEIAVSQGKTEEGLINMQIC
jgi:hypothetical protein